MDAERTTARLDKIQAERETLQGQPLVTNADRLARSQALARLAQDEADTWHEYSPDPTHLAAFRLAIRSRDHAARAARDSVQFWTDSANGWQVAVDAEEVQS